MTARLHGDCFEMYRNIEPLYCAPGTNMVLQVNYTSKTNKQTHRKRGQKEKEVKKKKRSDLWLSGSGGWRRGNWMAVSQKIQTSSYKINQY